MAENRIGIVGGGQLGRMLTEAAKPLGFEVTVLEKGDTGPAAQVGARQISGELKNPDDLRRLAEVSDVVTWEIEHIGVAELQVLAEQGYNIQPSPEALAVIQDKYEQKDLLWRMGIPVADFHEVNTAEDLETVCQKWRAAIIKTRTGGFDGRGNLVFDGQSFEEIAEYFSGSDGLRPELYAEEIIAFEKELSVIVAKDTEGRSQVFPVAETVHTENICDIVVAPAQVDTKIQSRAQALAHDSIQCFGGAGVFAVEMFMTPEGDLLVNEIAPRVHNSGHHTIEANITSQFQQHIRAITGLPLGSAEMRAPAAMVNILYGPISFGGIKKALAVPNAYLHLYGKEPRPGTPRKVGHITALGPDVDKAREQAIKAREELTNG